MKKNNIFVFPIIITIIKMIFLIPVNVTGGIAGINKRTYSTIFMVIANKKECHVIVDAFCYKIIYTKYITEGIIIFLIALIITFLIYILLRRKDDIK